MSTSQPDPAKNVLQRDSLCLVNVSIKCQSPVSGEEGRLSAAIPLKYRVLTDDSGIPVSS